jgi:thymidylate synthase (FAD)
MSDAAQKILEKEFRVLDKGFVRLIDFMGGDSRIVQAARVSYGAGTKTIREDKSLINYLVRNSHNTPIEQVELVFHVKAPLFVIAQWARHRTASTNQMSARYSEMKEEFYIPSPEEIRGQGTSNKQVGDGFISIEKADRANFIFEKESKRSYDNYNDLLELGVAREQSRMYLNQNLYTEMYWKIDLHNLFNFLRLRLHPHAQKEIRDYAKVMAVMAEAVAPLAYEAFEEHVLFSVKLSNSEAEVIRKILNNPSTIYNLNGDELNNLKNKFK